MSWSARFPGEVLYSSRTALGSLVLSGNTDLPLDSGAATKVPVPPNMGTMFLGVRCRIEFTVSPSAVGQSLGGYGYLSDSSGNTQMSPFEFYVSPADHNGSGYIDFAFSADAFTFSTVMAEVRHESAMYATATSSGSMPFGGSDPQILQRSMLDAATFTAEMFSSYGYTVSVDAVYVSWFPTSDTPVIPPPPEIYPPSGSYTGSQMFGIASAPGTYIRFTTDGTDPTITSEIWSRGLKMQDGLTVKAIAVADGDIVSSVASATYSLTGNKIQAIPSYQAAVLPYLLEQYKGDNP